MGGLGIRNVAMFNRAMLYKYAWRCEAQKESILSRMYKAKYGTLPLQAGGKGVTKPHWSWGFKGMCKVAMEFHKGMRWKLGNGRNINPEGDLWADNQEVKFKANTNDQVRKDFSKVESLIDWNKREWNQNLIWNNFPRMDAQRVLNSYIPENGKDDEQRWSHTKSGQYSVKMGYGFLVSQSDDHKKYQEDSKIWKTFWVINTLHKWKVFMWKVCNNALPTKTNINQRGIYVDPVCVFCNKEKETASHVFRDCEWSSGMWQSFPLGINTRASSTTTIQEWVKNWIRQLSREDDPYYDSTNIFFAGFWAIWKHRNEIIFRGVEPSPITIVETLHHWTNTSQKAAHNRVDRSGRTTTTSTRNEEENTVSIGNNEIGETTLYANVDSAWKMDKKCKDKNYAGIGWRIYNNITNTTIHTMSMPIRCTSAADAEARGILHLLKWLIEQEHKEVIVNTDCRVLIRYIETIQEAPTDLRNLIEDIRKLGNNFSFCKINFTSRQATLDAHKLAIQARITSLQESF
ncbi:uncharacterized protein [Spinacia oleracea]|uniref:Reverse transcriptase zinc-binding domain-containing protein n=1 Tax=Spinacia oleracea TaxID=3562 RepID=A0A9R0JYR5_SPIOL|nr:uncharacterized protein LOC110790908 [Spinacia oleracea]